MASDPALVAVIGFAEALSAPEVAWSLCGAGLEVVAFSRKGRNAALRHSRLVDVVEITAPEKDCAAALEDLAALLRSLADAYDAARLALLPLDDAALWLCDHVQASSRWVRAGAVRQQADLAVDKQRQIAAAEAAGFDVPPTAFVTTPDELASLVDEYPTILRPAHAVAPSDGRLHKGRNWICANRAELLRAQASWKGRETLIVQPFLDGIGEGIFGFATKKGVVAWSAHRRLRMMNPHGSGSSACISQEVPEQLKAPIEAFVRSCDWRGMFMIELLRTTDGRLWFVEFNGRAWGSMALSRRQGLEYPAWTIQLALDPDFVPAEILASTEPVVCRNLGRELMHLLFVARGPQSEAIRKWPSISRTILDLARFDRKTAFYNWRSDEWRVFFSDSWNTLRDNLFKRAG